VQFAGLEPTSDVLMANLERRWWWLKRDDLISKTPETGSVYVYDLPTLRASLNRLKQNMAAVTRFFYAMKVVDDIIYCFIMDLTHCDKANFNPAILAEVYNAGTLPFITS
jgi:diaminopimelate decarboxylase